MQVFDYSNDGSNIEMAQLVKKLKKSISKVSYLSPILTMVR